MNYKVGELKCQRCEVCLGLGCIGELPGLGGVFQNQNFQLNCEGWTELRRKSKQCGESNSGTAGLAGGADSKLDVADEISKIPVSPSNLRCGPVTGAVENIGFANESDFYLPYLRNAYQSGIGLCVGDGCPDQKLHLGVEAVAALRINGAGGVESDSSDKKNSGGAEKSSCSGGFSKAAFFLKPYPDKILLERIKLVRPYAEYIGIDIDSYNIITMRNLVNLERKTAAQIEALRAECGVPFVIKGVFTDKDIELVKEVRPDVVYISNHGGRVETRIGSTAEFLYEHAAELKKYCSQIWVDGGIRCKADVQTALYYGASQVVIARPFIRATFDNCYSAAIKEFVQ